MVKSLTLLFLFAFNLCAKNWVRQAYVDSIKKVTKISPEYELLEHAYKEKSDSLKQLFFDEWQMKSDSLKGKVRVLTPYEQDIYDVFMCIYGTYKKENVRCKYLVIQGSIHYFLLKDSFFEDKKNFSSLYLHKLDHLKKSNLTVFAPPVSCRGKEVLFRSEHYYNVVNTFLMECTDLAISITSDSRESFLYKDIPFRGFHWGGGYNVTSFPEVGFVLLNESGTKAFVTYRTSFCEGGSSILVKENGSWKVSEVLSGWIE